MDLYTQILGRLTVETFVWQPEVAHLADNAAVLPHILLVRRLNRLLFVASRPVLSYRRAICDG